MEEKKKGGLWLRVVLSIVGSGVLVAAIGYLLFYVMLSVLWGRLGKGLEADKEALRKSFRENLQKYYGLSEGYYVIAEESYAGIGKVTNPVYRFIVNGKKYHSAGTGEGLYTDYYVDSFFEAAKEQIRRTVDGSGILTDEAYTVRVTDCVFRGWEENYRHRVNSSLLPVWLNEAEVSHFTEGNVDRDKWKEEINLHCDILLNPTKELEITKEQFEAMRDELFYVQEFNFYTQNVIYHYNPKTGALTEEKR